MKFPLMYQARYELPSAVLKDVGAEVARLLESSRFWEKVQPGARIGLTAGSRGIGDIVPILKAAVRFIKGKGFQPYIIPAMGSHGGDPGRAEKAAGRAGNNRGVAGGSPVATGEAVRIGEAGPGSQFMSTASPWRAKG